MATYYGVKGSSNWNSGNWSTTSAKDATRTGSGVTPTASDDCILDDWSSDGGGVTWTINATTCVCKTLNCTGYAGALVFTSGQVLTVAGSVTFTNAMTCTGAGNLTVSGAGTITTGGISVGISNLVLSAAITINSAGTTWVTVSVSGTRTITLASALSCTTLSTGATGGQTVTFAGAYDITCANFYHATGSSITTVKFVAGQTITVSTSLFLNGNSASLGAAVQSATASSDTFLHYDGAAADCHVGFMLFTDVNCAHPIDNWHGGTLTRTTGIYNVTQASFPAVGDVKSAVEYGGVDEASANRLTGTYAGGGGGVIVATPGMNGGIN